MSTVYPIELPEKKDDLEWHKEVARLFSYVTYAGNPNSNLTPRKIWDRCLDTTNRTWYVSHGTGNTDWKVIGELYVSPEDFGAVGDGVTDDSATVQAALYYWESLSVPGIFKFTSGRNYLCNTALSLTFSSNITGGWAIMGYGSILTSGLSSGYLLTLASEATVRHLPISGLYLVGSGSEYGGIKLDGGTSGSEYLYGLKLNDVDLDGFGGNGIHVTRNVFESSFNSVNVRTNDTTGSCMLFDNGADGIVSSIDLANCNTSGGDYGVRVVSPTSDVKIIGGTYILAQKEGILLENAAGTIVINAHLENNYEGAADLANGGAGLRMVNYGDVLGVTGWTDSKQRYVVNVYTSAGKQSNIIGGAARGDTVYYAYINGANYSSVNIYGDATYEISNATPCSINRTFTHKDSSTAATSGTGEDDLHTYVIPAETMGKMGGLRIFAAGTKVGANGEKTLKLHLGASSWTFHPTTTDQNTDSWELRATILNYNSESSQRVSWHGYDGVSLSRGFGTDTIDTSSDAILKITGECSHSDDVINQFIWIVESL